MFDVSTLIVFSVATVVFLIAPGPGVLYIVALSVNQGRLAGLVSTLGLNAGALVHVGAAALGLSTLLVSSAVAFNVVKYAGAAYLIYLGIQQLRQRDEAPDLERKEKASPGRLFLQGFLVSVFNPKLAVFFLAFLPQFVDPARGSIPLQILFLGALFILLGFVTDAAYALAAGSLGNLLRGNLRFLRAQRWFAGTTLIGLGLAAAFTGSGRNE